MNSRFLIFLLPKSFDEFLHLFFRFCFAFWHRVGHYLCLLGKVGNDLRFYIVRVPTHGP